MKKPYILDLCLKYLCLKHLCILIPLLILSSCLDSLPKTRSQYLKEWTIITYMIADNDLDYFSDEDINEMEEIGSSDKVDFIVIRDRLDTSKGINVYWIFKDEDRVRIRSPIVKVYDELDMCDTKTINETISYVINNFPSEKYALILWSHGSGAVPKWYNPLWFGEDYSHKSRFDIDEPN